MPNQNPQRRLTYTGRCFPVTIPAGQITGDAGSSVTLAGQFAADDAQGFSMPYYVRNTFQYTSASAVGSGSAFTRLHGSANYSINHSNDSVDSAATGSIFTIQGGDQTNFVPAQDTLNVYLNGIRLMSGSGLDYMVTGSVILDGGKPAMRVNFTDVLLQTGDTVVIDFQNTGG